MLSLLIYDTKVKVDNFEFIKITLLRFKDDI